jgi:subtilisin family serine protease
VKIAILDVGIETFNAEFTGARFLRGPDFTNGDENPEADHPHGIYTLGLLAANADNDFGGAGVDHRSEILVIKVLNGFNRGSVADLAAGIIEAAQEDADIISMSLIDYGNTNTLNLALEVAQSAGSILIACAGNGGIGNADISYPGASPLTISIGSVDSQERRTAISGTGAMLDFVAPGENLFTVASGSGNELTQFSGCSAATPLAAGIAGLMKAVNPQLTQADIKDIWIDTARDLIGPGSQDTLGRDDQYGYGMLDAAAAVQLAVEINVPISEKIENTAPISVLEKLELLDLSGNLINQIDLSAFSALAELSLANNLLGEIDVTRNAALVLLNLGNNNLSSIDISQNPLLELVDLSNNPVPCEFIDDLRSQRPEIQIEASCN